MGDHMVNSDRSEQRRNQSNSADDFNINNDRVMVLRRGEPRQTLKSGSRIRGLGFNCCSGLTACIKLTQQSAQWTALSFFLQFLILKNLLWQLICQNICWAGLKVWSYIVLLKLIVIKVKEYFSIGKNINSLSPSSENHLANR